MSALCFMNKSSNSVKMFSGEVLASEPQRSFTSCGCYSGPGMGAISSGSVRLCYSRSQRPSSVSSIGSVDDKNSNSDKEVNCESVLRLIFSKTLSTKSIWSLSTSVFGFGSSTSWGTALNTRDTGTTVPKWMLLRIRCGMLVSFITLIKTWPVSLTVATQSSKNATF